MLPPPSPWKSKIFRLNSSQELNPVPFDIHKRCVSQLVIITHSLYGTGTRQIVCFLTETTFIVSMLRYHSLELPVFIYLFVFSLGGPGP